MATTLLVLLTTIIIIKTLIEHTILSNDGLVRVVTSSVTMVIVVMVYN